MVGIALPRARARSRIKASQSTGLQSETQTADRGERFALASWGERVTVEPGRSLSVERPEAFLGIVVSGQLEKRVIDGTRALVIETLAAGATFLLHPRDLHHEAPPSLCAVHRTVVSVLDREGLVQAFAHLPALSLSVFAETARRLARVEDRLEEVAFASGRTRLARLLLRLTVFRGRMCVRGVSQQKMAAWLGVHRESLTTLLAQMREEGLVSSRRLYIEILDEAALRQLADAGTGKWLDSGPPDLEA